MKTKYWPYFLICIILTVLAIVTTAISLFTKGNVSCYITLASLLMVTYYAAFGYKEPHGNLFKYTTLLYAASLLFKINQHIMTTGGKEQLSIVVLLVAMMMVVYFAGRLNKIQKNRVIISITLVLFVAYAIILIINRPVNNFLNVMSAFTPLITWLDIAYAYFLRYDQHTRAGQEATE